MCTVVDSSRLAYIYVCMYISIYLSIVSVSVSVSFTHASCAATTCYGYAVLCYAVLCCVLLCCDMCVCCRCMSLPPEIFQYIIELLPVPRIWHWSLMRLRKHARVVPQLAAGDICIIMDDIISDAGIFKGKHQKRLLGKINSNPEVNNQLINQ